MRKHRTHDRSLGGVTSRRDFLAGLGAAAIAGAAAGTSALAQGPRRLIDTHHHVVAPKWAAYLRDNGLFIPPVSDISIARIIDHMDRDGVAVCINSLVATQRYLPYPPEIDAAASRDANEYMAKLSMDFPGRFGTFAQLPMSNVDAALREIEYAFDTLSADGVQLFTSHEDKWLGDAYYAPVFDELNRRRTVVYTHPHEAACCRNPLSDTVNSAFIEFGTDTSRAIARYIFSGSATKYRDMKIIFSHAGGTMPFLINRFIVQAKDPRAMAVLPDGLDAELRRLYFDTAQVYHTIPMQGLKTMVPVSQILFGTDFPYRTAGETIEGVRNTGVFTAAEMTAIESGNARRLIARLSG